jgi:hypothetical protein
MNVLAAASMLVLIASVVVCLGIQFSLIVKRQLKSPHEIVALAKSGHKAARTCVRLYVLAVVALVVLVVSELLRGF